MKKLSKIKQDELDKRKADKVSSIENESLLKDKKEGHISNYFKSLSHKDSKILVDHFESILTEGEGS